MELQLVINYSTELSTELSTICEFKKSTPNLSWFVEQCTCFLSLDINKHAKDLNCVTGSKRKAVTKDAEKILN